jgi:phospholipid/cholesterol/gamma-HCH transport system substrate-binding protein
MSRELKIGIFLAVVLAIMAIFIFTVGDLGRLFQKPGYPLIVYFDTAAGVDEGVLVRVAGIKVGRVKKIALVGIRARFTLVITPSFQVPRGSRATQAILGLLGEKYIEILPGSGPGYCDPGDELEGLSPIGFDQIGKLFISIGGEIKDVSATLKEMVNDKSRKNVKDILQNMSEFTSELDEFLAKNKDGLGRSIQGSSQAIQDFDRKVQEISASLTEAVTAIKGIAEDNRESVRTSLTRIQELLSRMDEVVRLMKETMDKVDKGQGTLGKLVNEPGLYSRAEEAVDKARAVLDPISALRTDFSFRTDYYGESDKLKSALSLALWLNPKALVLAGVANDPWRDRFTYSLQSGLRWMNFVPRAGIIESEFGAGLDYLAFRDRVVLSLEGFDFNRDRNPRFRLFGRWMPFDHISILLGMDDVIERRAREVFFGIGIHSR